MLLHIILFCFGMFFAFMCCYSIDTYFENIELKNKLKELKEKGSKK